jgi:hypothetical protein
MLLPPSVPIPDTLKGIDDLIRINLEAFRATWFVRLLAATFLVVVGLVMEGPELWHEIHSIIWHWSFKRSFHFSLPEEHPPEWAKLLAFAGWMFIVIGVGGEFVADSFLSKADGYVQKFDEILLTEAQRGTALARERASAAYERASENEKETANTLKQAEQERADAAKSLAAAETARKEAEGFQLQIAQANERAAQAEEQSAKAELELAKLKTPRTLSIEQQERIASMIKRFPGTPYDLWVSGDSDSTALMGLIDSTLRSADWKFNPPETPLMFGNKAGIIADSGISIHVPEEHRAEWEASAVALRDALVTEGIAALAFADNAETNKQMGRNRIHILIGSKPLN